MYTYTRDWDEFLADIEGQAIGEAWASPSSIEANFEFTGTRTWDEAHSLLTHGWREGRSKLADSTEFAKAVTRQGVSEAWQHAPAGAFPHVPAYCAGIAECMMTPPGEEQRTSLPIVTIAVNIGAAHFTSTSVMINRGAAIVALIDSIEAQGQRVELICCTRSILHNNGGPLDIRVTVKRADEHVDLDRIAFTMAHPSMLRRMKFRIMEFTLPDREYGYGTPADLHDDDFEHGTMYIPKFSHSRREQRDMYGTEEQAVQTVADMWEAARTEWQVANDELDEAV